MLDQIQQWLTTIQQTHISNAEEAEQFRLQFLSRKGILNDLFEQFKTVPNEQKRAVGQQLNVLKQAAQSKWEACQSAAQQVATPSQFDFSIPSAKTLAGSHHPLSIVQRDIVQIFERIGFHVAEGPEIEDDWHNFSALNFPPEHPARDMQDTFFIEKGENEMALRTHTSSVQVRVMENDKPPIRTISPGRVYRN